MIYRVKPEYVDLWGEDLKEITEDELQMIARGWEKDPAELMDQLIPQESKRISLDNGRTFMDAAEAVQAMREQAEESGVPFKTIWENVAYQMDDGIRETVHIELAPCTEEAFLRRYLELSSDDFIVG